MGEVLQAAGFGLVSGILLAVMLDEGYPACATAIVIGMALFGIGLAL